MRSHSLRSLCWRSLVLVGAVALTTGLSAGCGTSDEDAGSSSSSETSGHGATSTDVSGGSSTTDPDTSGQGGGSTSTGPITDTSGSGGSTEVCGPCPPVEWLDCDGDFAIVLASLPGPDCTCVDTEVERTDCTQTNRRCLDGQCVECIEDRDCPAMGRPRCEGSNQINNRGRCNPDNTCTMVGVPTFCEYGCEEGECLPEPPCPTLDCPGTPGPPSCDGDVWVTPLLVPDPDNCEVCIEVDQRWLCGGNEVCDPDLGCLPGGCDPCPVFDPPAPVCEGDVAVEATGYEQDPVTCVCTETFRRTDCTAQEQVCDEGVCRDR